MLPKSLPPRLLACAALLLALISATATAPAASTIAVSGSILSSTQVTNQCTGAAARSFGTVTVNTLNLTGVCRFQFGATNGLATARLSQRDGTGTAMAMSDGNGSASRPQDPGWRAIDVVDGSVTFAGRTDGRIVRTANDGTTWQVENSGTTWPVTGIAAIDTTNAYATGSCGFGCPFILKRTTGGGTTWTTQTLPGGFVAPLVDIAFQPGTPNTAVAVGFGGNILRTTDGGTTWNTVASGTTNALRSISFFSGTLAYAGGDNGTLLRSVDAGATWATIATPLPDAIQDVSVAPGPNLFYITATRIYRSTNPAAATPTIVDIGGPAGTCSMLSLTTPSASTVMFAGNYTCQMQRSVDALAATPTWTSYSFGSVGTVNSLDADTTTHAMSAIHTGAIDRTVDGTTWAGSLVESSRVSDVASWGTDVAMAVGGSGFVWTTSDAGSTWQTRSTGSTRHIQAVELESATEAWASGNNGRAWHTTDGGATWTEFNTGAGVTLQDITLLRDGALLVVGGGGYIGRSTNGGASWTTIPSGTGGVLRRISVEPGDNRIWIGGQWSATSTDDGKTFVNGQAQPGDMVDIAAAGANAAFAITSGQLLRSPDAGVTWNNIGSITPVFAESLEAPSPSDIMISEFGGIHVSHDGGFTWSWIGGGFGRGEFAAPDAHRAYWGGDGGAMVKLVPTASSITDYAAGGWAGASSRFGVCVQAIGANTAPVWTVDAAGLPGQCQTNDADPWYAVPTSPTPIATSTANVTTAQIDLVWGLKVSSSQPPGNYLAPVEFSVISP